MNIAEFRANLRSTLDGVVQSGKPLSLTCYDRPQARVVPEELWQEAEAALQRERARNTAREASMT